MMGLLANYTPYYDQIFIQIKRLQYFYLAFFFSNRQNYMKVALCTKPMDIIYIYGVPVISISIRKISLLVQIFKIIIPGIFLQNNTKYSTVWLYKPCKTDHHANFSDVIAIFNLPKQCIPMQAYI